MVWGHSWPSDVWNYVQGSGTSLTNQQGGNYEKEEKEKGKKVRKEVQTANVSAMALIITKNIYPQKWTDKEMLDYTTRWHCLQH